MKLFSFRITQTLDLIKFSHSIFALPFALGSMLVAAHGLPNPLKFLWILLAIVFARTSAMAFNRWLDADIDAKNPRTQSRHLPQKIFSKNYVLALCIATALLFVAMAYLLGGLCLWLSLPALAILFFYSATKRFTHFSHFFLGLALGVAPIGAWIAIRNELNLAPIILAGGVLLWVAGFDVLYATQDVNFDQSQGLHSLVVKLGVSKALQAARVLHGLAFLLFLFFGYEAGLGASYFVILGLMGLAFIYQHTLLKPNDLSKLDTAFFTVNGLISFLFLGGVLLAVGV